MTVESEQYIPLPLSPVHHIPLLLKDILPHLPHLSHHPPLPRIPHHHHKYPPRPEASTAIHASCGIRSQCPRFTCTIHEFYVVEICEWRLVSRWYSGGVEDRINLEVLSIRYDSEFVVFADSCWCWNRFSYKANFISFFCS